jgi:hypothetical protein
VDLPELSPTAWALLGTLHRATRGGPVAPLGALSDYAELQAHELIKRVRHSMVPTEKGETALHEWERLVPAQHAQGCQIFSA